ncbi:MAG: DUF6644 family protein, partial [Gammaproteobacteria bacterium]
MSLHLFLEWLAATPASVALHESRYLYLVVLTTHVLTLFLFVGTIILQSLRLMGLGLTSVPASNVLSQLRPWMLLGFAIMAVSGSLLFFAAPVDKFVNMFFRVKLLLILLAGINIVLFNKTIYRQIETWDLAEKPPRS